MNVFHWSVEKSSCAAGNSYMRFGLALLLFSATTTVLQAQRSPAGQATTSPTTNRSEADSANWIWTSGQLQQQVPEGTVYFRRKFEVDDVELSELVVAADDVFRVYINGKLVATGEGYDRMTKIDLASFLKNGPNIIAVQVTNRTGKTAALGSAMRFKRTNETQWRWIATDENWKTSTTRPLGWNLIQFDDSAWLSAASLGPIGKTLPWDAARMNAQTMPETGSSSGESPRVAAAAEPTNNSISPSSSKTLEKVFRTPDSIQVERIFDGSIGSIIAMEFNEFGQLIMSQERGGLLLADLSNAKEGKITVRKYCDLIQAIQGILPLNGNLYVTGLGPQGMGLYRLSTPSPQGLLQNAELLLGFTGPPSEHGAHGLVLGNDGMIYVTIGNASGLVDPVASTSPIHTFYEGDIIPRLEDPGGHAAGTKAPGGMVVRVSIDGKQKEIVASGLRNAYDLAINRAGEMFFHDSDMESDIGTPWYRPTQIYHLAVGAEYGWRSGSAKFPTQFIDALPGIGDTGRGSPSGAVVYDHFMLPKKYRGALFLGDWSEGRILAVHVDQSSHPYQTRIEEFLSASPLPVTDLSVGPDGGLYFSTGGRGTEGGIYRISWQDADVSELPGNKDLLFQLIKSPQPQSAWARQSLAELQIKMGEQWERSLLGVLSEPKNKTPYRVKALDTLLLFGPVPSDDMLLSLASDSDPAIRQRVLVAFKRRQGDGIVAATLDALHDPDTDVRRTACETLIHHDAIPRFADLKPLLQSESRHEVLIARRLLERLPTDQWKNDALSKSADIRVFLESSLVLMIVEPTLRNGYDVLARTSHVLENYLSDRDFYDLLRVVQLALDQADVDPAKIPLFSQKLAGEFPTTNGKLNRELSRVLAYLESANAQDRLADYIESSPDSDLDKLQVLTHMRQQLPLLPADVRLSILAFLERVQSDSTQGNMRLYVAELTGPLTEQIQENEFNTILARGGEFPSTSLAIFYRMSEHLDDSKIQSILEIDRVLKDREDLSAVEARIGCVAMLAQSGNDQAMTYLREVWRAEPERRNDVVLGLAQQPEGDNWPYLVSSLEGLNDDTAGEVLRQLKKVNRRPQDPIYFRHVILAGHRLRADGASAADQLLRHWTNEEFEPTSAKWRTVLDEWAAWFNEKYPDLPRIQFEDLTAQGNYSVDQLLSYIEQSVHAPNLEVGKALFASAQCSKCHQFEHQGESMGPDLNSIARRFSTREILKAIVHPSAVIPDRYQAKKVLTLGGRQISGLVTETERGIVILQGTGEKVVIPADEVDEIVTESTSSMPNGLLDTLSADDVRNLLSYLDRLESPESKEMARQPNSVR